MYLQNEKYWLSLSVPRLFNVIRDDEISIGAKDRIHAYMGGGFKIALNDVINIKPSVMFRKVKALPLKYRPHQFYKFSRPNRSGAVIQKQCCDVIDGFC